ncbi:MAG: response regulator, partial [Saprospiraceae bacterium]|nr:response regulator [Saprospiraceae bacterium]
SENTAFSVMQDSLGYIWSGSYGGGLNRLDTATNRFVHFSTNDGLLNNNIFSVIADKRGYLWLLSYEGITRFNPYSFEIINLTHGNGLGSDFYDGFLYGRSPSTGNLFFLGKDGLDFFHPDSVKLSNYKPPIAFTGFELFNEPVQIDPEQHSDSDTFFLQQHISYTREIKLDYDHRVFTIDYAALDFSGPENIDYAYQLDGFDPDWQYVDKKRSATYTNLDPGNYEFRVKSTNADGVWNENYTALALIISPPWWNTGLAYFFYFVLIVSALYFFYWYQRRRWELQSALQIQEKEALRLKELDNLKTNLYTNITHEFRTPLTIIGGMTRLIREKPRDWLKKGADTIEEQSQKLLEMVSQMLDLQKIEAGRLELQPVQTDIISFINHIIEPFLFQARAKRLDFEVKHETADLIVDFDPQKLATVISNVVSNALKFTDQGQVILSTRITSGTEKFQILIEDTGMGIHPDKLDHIFDRFYQADHGSTRTWEGTGIGLSLVKELVTLMRGTIEVESNPGKGSRFRIHLPVTRLAKPPGVPVISQQRSFPALHPEPPISIRAVSTSKRGRVLIVEDNTDVRRYLSTMLESEYRILEAVNGEQGIDMAKKEIPDLVISDIMMPVKDGYQVCDELHQDPLTAHIPIILLTAKADRASKVQGFRKGADSYLSKPFHPEELKAQIQMLLEQRKRLQAKYREGLSGVHYKQVSEKDQFIEEVYHLIISRLSIEDFGIGDICKNMLVSRSQLHNKIKATTGLSTSHFIRKIRLEQARKLIAGTEMTIAEIAYQVGFKDPNFFSRVYKLEFGESPSEGRE